MREQCSESSRHYCNNPEDRKEDNLVEKSDAVESELHRWKSSLQGLLMGVMGRNIQNRVKMTPGSRTKSLELTLASAPHSPFPFCALWSTWQRFPKDCFWSCIRKCCWCWIHAVTCHPSSPKWDREWIPPAFTHHTPHTHARTHAHTQAHTHAFTVPCILCLLSGFWICSQSSRASPWCLLCCTT